MYDFQFLRSLIIFSLNVALCRSLRSSHMALPPQPVFALLRPGFQTRYRFQADPSNMHIRNWSFALKSSTFSDNELGISMQTSDSSGWYSSHIASIKAYNLAGVVNQGDDKIISINFGDSPNLVAVTGETGSGKSLLIAKVAELVTGGKATASLLPPSGYENDNDNVVIVEMEISLSHPHLSQVQNLLERRGLEAIQLVDSKSSSTKLKLRRVLSIVGPSIKGGKRRLKSVCEINGKAVSLKDLKAVASPLITIVDAATAATALSKASARIAIIDTAVQSAILDDVRRTQEEYKKCREHREKIENELATRALPPSLVAGGGEQDLVLLQHWVDELDRFRGRMTQFCKSFDHLSKSQDSFGEAARALSEVLWSDNADTESWSSLMYISILDFREALKLLDSQLVSARLAFQRLGSLSTSESALTAVDRSRNHLFDVTASENPDGSLAMSAEITHHLLNTVEQNLRACLKSLEDESNGLLSMLQNSRDNVGYSVGDIDEIIGDWNSLARKHGITSYALPSCHAALHSELHGNVEAKLLLPKAISQEIVALKSFEFSCAALSAERQKIGESLSMSITKRMPSLGLEGSRFDVSMRSDVRMCSDASCYKAFHTVGLDSVDFVLLHEVGSALEKHESRGGNVDVVASSGEKARLLLAIECEHPGSIGASCCIARQNEGEETMGSMYSPIAVIYDEIDAHVGGRAAVAMGVMLADQSRKRSDSGARGQVISITHSPSVAAIADVHLVIKKATKSNGENSVPVTAAFVKGSERRKEVARMASGDLAPDEAEAFAHALLRDGAKRRSSIY